MRDREFEAGVQSDEEMLTRVTSGAVRDDDGELARLLVQWRSEIDAYDFFMTQALAATQVKPKRDLLGTIVSIMFVFVVLGYMTSIVTSLYSTEWAVYVSAASGGLAIVTILAACKGMLRR